MLLGARTAIAVAVDEFFNRVTLLLPGDGTNGAQNNTFLDSSTNNFTITRNGNTTQGTFSPFSQTGWSNYFNRSNYTNIYAASSADFNFGSGDFTIECFFNPSYVPASGDSTFTRLFDTGQVTCFFFSGNIYFRNAASAELVTVVAHGLSVGVWYHLAFVRSGTTYLIFRNGIQLTSGTGGTITSASAPFVIGANASYSQPLDGYVSDFRVTTGQALYTSTFTPATTPLTTTSQSATASNVKLLTCQSNRFVDNSTQSTKTILFGDNGANLGTRFVQPFSPFAPAIPYSAATVGGSGYFDGSGDTLDTPTTGQFAPTGDFTIGLWFYPNSALNINQNLVGNLTTNASTDWLIQMQSMTINFYTNGTTVRVAVSGAVIPFQWNYISMTRSSNVISAHVNGTSLGTYSQSGTFGSATKKIEIGNATNNINGYISGLVFVDGTANTAIPTAPPSPTGTSLCLNFTNAGITDATAKNVLETVGNAQISTTQSKFGGSSMYFDGTGDYLVGIAANAGMNPQSGDFTVEFWAWIPSLPNAEQPICATITTGGSGLLIGLAGGGNVNKIQFAIGNLSVGNPTVVDSSTFPVTTWTHIAAVRSGGTIYLYKNGTSVGTPTSASGTISQPTITIGAWPGGSAVFNGYIDDLRITRYARYTSNFTPPTAAFALQ